MTRETTDPGPEPATAQPSPRPQRADPLAAPGEERPLAAPPPLPPGAEPVVVPRWVQMVMLPMALLGLYAAVQAAGEVVLLFLIGGVSALILNPLVKVVEGRLRGHRGIAVAVVFLGFLLALSGLGALLVDPVGRQVSHLQRDVPHLVDQANRSLAGLQRTLDSHHIDIHIKNSGQTALQTLEKNVLRGSGNLVSFTRDLVKTIVGGALALVLVIVLSVYFLLYSAPIGRLVRAAMPPGDGTAADDYPLRVQRAVFGYVRGQLAFSLIMGTSAGVALWLLGAAGVFPDGRRYALFFGAFYGIMELVPYVGPVLGALPPVLVALFGDPLTAVWVALLFLGLQQIEGHVVAPQVFSHSLRINPLIVIFALLFGTAVYGIPGALIALPMAAVLRETVIYLRRHLVLEPWSVRGRPARPCPGCATPSGPGDVHCRRCGALLDGGPEQVADH